MKIKATITLVAIAMAGCQSTPPAGFDSWRFQLNCNGNRESGSALGRYNVRDGGERVYGIALAEMAFVTFDEGSTVAEGFIEMRQGSNGRLFGGGVEGTVSYSGNTPSRVDLAAPCGGTIERL